MEISADKWRLRLEKAAARARKSASVDAIHQVRVAAARLRVWLQLNQKDEWIDELKRLRRSAGRVRDLQVMIMQDPPKAFAVELRRQIPRARAELLRALRGPRLVALLHALRTAPPLRVSKARKGAAKLAAKTIAAKPRSFSTAKPPKLHRLRRLVRRTRYALDWIDESPGVIVDLQDALGAVIDATVVLERVGDRAELREYRAQVQERLRRDVRRLNRYWKRARRALQALST